jgi:PleD family two-component response regulator
MALRLDPKLLNPVPSDPNERLQVKILVVDEDESTFASIVGMLKAATRIDVTARYVADYETAFGALLSNQDDVCLVGYRLGTRTGLELLGEAARASTRAPLILLGGPKDVSNDMTAMRMGAADFLDRSRLSTDVLERSIRYALERKRTEDRLVYLAQHDHMTGLVNRTLFRERLDRAISRARRGG